MGRTRRHDRLRDRVRHRAARPSELRGVSRGSVTRTAMAGAGTAAALVASAWAAQRIAAGRVRRRFDADARRALETPLYVDHRLPSHDGGTVYVVESGAGP